MTPNAETQLNPAELKKWQFLEQAPSSDAKNEKLRRLAQDLWEAALHRPRWFAFLAHSLARDCIAYETDGDRVGHEDIAGFTRDPQADDAIDALERGIDDCDAKARVFVALCLCVGIPAEMWGYEKNGELLHVAARCHIDGQWWHVETTLIRARLGDDHLSVPKEL